MKKQYLPPLPPPGPDKAAWLEDGREVLTGALREWKRKETALSFCRLLAFMAAVTGFFVFWTAAPVLAGVSLVLGFAVFLIARHHHRRMVEQVDMHTLLETVLHETEMRLGGDPVVIRAGERPAAEPRTDRTPLWENGKSWALSPQEMEDFDLYAEPVGLFGLLNRTSTHIGAGRLARALENPLLVSETIAARQEAVRRLGERPGDRLLLLAAAAGLRDQDAELDLFADTVRDAKPLSGPAAHPLVRAASFLTMAAAAVVIALEPGTWLLVLAALTLLNAPVLIKARRDLLVRIRPWLRLDVVTRRLTGLAETAATILPAEGQLGRINEAFRKAGEPPALPALAFRIPYLFLGFSGMLHKLVNALTLWDLHWICALERSYLNHRDELLGAVEALAELEVLLSFAAFHWEQPVVCLPELRTEAEALRITGGCHPLIAIDEVVANDLDFRLPMRIWIITGSNMSGKSTYLRMVGICTLLAQTGCAVPAAAMTLAPAAILTDLRVRDDLGKHESYFLAEVRQVKRILDHSRSGGNLLGLIDEPFRGTNSEERLASATAVIEALIDGNGFFLVATHDRQVTTLADEKAVGNHHFQETLAEDVLSFDYKIRSGPATARNAIKVLRAEGYPEKVVESAERIVQELDAAD